MEDNKKVLIATPTYDGMKYCDNRFFDAIKSLTYPNHDILVVENSKNSNYFNKLSKDPDLNVLRYEPKGDEKNMQKLINCRNLILDYALKNDYDYILMLDSDVKVPKDIIEKLLASDKDIISGIYFNYFTMSGKNQILPVAWKALTESEFENIKQTINLPDFVKSNEDLRRHLTKKEVDSNDVLEVIFPSAGCMLIKKNVFARINYSLVDTSKYNNMSTTDEIHFLIKVKEAGLKLYCDTSIKCEHMLKGKFVKDANNQFVNPVHD
ncbi:hypothetical protein GOV14_05455 [Candidatus Pacearchaeota archaeon]|nr:hypothetical protein [Candidatus Pacearchaeota archaeon]